MKGEVHTNLDMFHMFLLAAIGAKLTDRYLSGNRLWFTLGAAATGFYSNWDSWVSMQGSCMKPSVYGALLAAAFGNNPDVFGFNASPVAGIIAGSTIFSLRFWFRKREAMLTEPEDKVF